jgi:ornithine carrier protein
VAYNEIQQSMRRYSGLSKDDRLSYSNIFVAGTLAGTIVSFVITPVELLKCRLQTQSYIDTTENSVKHRGPLSCLNHTVRTQGIKGLYKGHVGTLLREGAGGAAWFGSYEYAINRMILKSETANTKNDLSAAQLMSAGALAGMAYNAAFYPADVVKSRMQSGLHPNEGLMEVTKNIYQSYGTRGFFRGFGLTLARSAPSSGIIFLTYVLFLLN